MRKLSILSIGSEPLVKTIAIPESLQDEPTHKLQIVDDLASKAPIDKSSHLQQIKQKVIYYQVALIGASDEYELERYRVNAEAADGLIADNINPQLLATFTQFFESVKAKNPEKFAGFDVRKFAKWIQIKKLTSKSGVLLIGAIANISEKQIIDANDEDNEAVVDSLNQSAEDKFNEVMLLAVSQMYQENCIDAESLDFLQSAATYEKMSVDEFVDIVTAE